MAKERSKRWRGRLTRLAMLSGAAGSFGLIPVAAGQTVVASWLNPVDGTWTDASKWSSDPNYPNNGTPAGSLYDVTIGAGGGSYTVTLKSDITVSSIALDYSAATLQLDNGTIHDATITGGSGDFSVKFKSNGTLSNVNLQRPLTVRTVGGGIAGGDLYVDSNSQINSTLQLNGTGRIHAIGSGSLNGNGQIIFGKSFDDGPAVVSGANMTIGPNLAIRSGLGGGNVGTDSLSFTNLGTIEIATPSVQSIDLFGTWTNQGTLSATGGFLNLNGVWINQGTLSGGGGILSLNGSWTNQGTIAVNDGTVNLGGTFSPPSIGTVVHAGGNLIVNGFLNNASQTFNVGSQLGTVIIAGGTISGGRIETSGNGQLVANYGSRLSAATLATSLLVNGDANIVNCTLDGGTIHFAGGSNSLLSLGVVFGDGEIDWDAGTLNNLLTTAGIHVRSGPDGGQLKGNIDNSGTLTINSPGQNINVFNNFSANNHGVIEAVAGQLTFQGITSNFGTVTVSSGATLSLGDQTYNEGTILVNHGALILNSRITNYGPLLGNDGTVIFNGTSSNVGTMSLTNTAVFFNNIFSTAEMGMFSNVGGSNEIGRFGSLNNAGSKLAVTPTTGSFRLVGGTISGGSIEAAAGVPFTFDSGTLVSVSLAGAFIKEGMNNGLWVTGSLALAGASIDIQGPPTTIATTGILANGSVIFDGSNYGTHIDATSDTLTIGNGVSLRTGSGSGSVGNLGHWTVNNGTISAVGAGRAIILTANVLNNGTLESLDGGSLDVTNLSGGLGNITIQNGGRVGISGSYTVGSDVDVPGSSLTLSGTWSNSATISADSSSLTLSGAWSNNATISANNSSLSLNGTWLNNGTIALSNGTLQSLATAMDNGSITLDHSFLRIGGAFNTALDVLGDSSVSILGGTTLTLRKGMSLVPGVFNFSSSVFNTSLRIGPNMTLAGSGSLVFDDSTSLVLIQADSGSFTIGPSISIGTGNRSGTLGSSLTGLINQGLVTAQSGRMITVAGSFSNISTLQSLNGATLSLSGNWSNSGTIIVDHANLVLGGTFATGAIGQIEANSANIYVPGTIDNSNATITLDSNIFAWNFSGSITGGTLTGSAGQVFQASGGGMSNVNLAAEVDVQSGASFNFSGTFRPGGKIVLLGGGGTTSMTSLGTFLPVTLLGTGEVVFDGTSSFSRIFGPSIFSGITIRTGSAGGTITSISTQRGTISSQTAGMTLNLDRPFSNRGLLEARNGGVLSIFPSSTQLAGTLDLISTGTYAVYANSTLSLGSASIGKNICNLLLDGVGSSFPSINSLNTTTGRFTIRNGRNFNSVGSLTNSGTVTIGLGSAMKIAGSLNNTGTVDLDGVLIVDYLAGGSSFTTLAGQVASGFAGGAWNGPGINSSVSALIEQADGDAVLRRNGIGIAEAGSIGMVGTGTFAGQAVDDTSTLLRYTVYGDADLDGIVNSADFTRLAANFGQSGKFWSDGDYNYDGTVNSLDFNALASNFGQQMAFPSQPLLGQTVPEPTSAIGMLLVACGAMAVRRRSQKPRH